MSSTIIEDNIYKERWKFLKAPTNKSTNQHPSEDDSS